MPWISGIDTRSNLASDLSYREPSTESELRRDFAVSYASPEAKASASGYGHQIQVQFGVISTHPRPPRQIIAFSFVHDPAHTPIPSRFRAFRFRFRQGGCIARADTASACMGYYGAQVTGAAEDDKSVLV